ncbi:MerR family transcriptional regulator [Sporolactobacillus terrae]|uniref:MerR family transcriptional regulator n=1 Tax=Sporolactobacillus terrae TaxID=269673 RepID=UPI0013620614|nr:MerR family transcriptional regulator [Sporolactobacillus terrae]
MKTKQAAKTLRLADTTLRFYEKIGLIQPKRGANHYRLFDEKLLLQIKYIAVMKSAGFSLATIKEFMNFYPQPVSAACNQSTQRLLKIQKESIRMNFIFLSPCAPRVFKCKKGSTSPSLV